MVESKNNKSLFQSAALITIMVLIFKIIGFIKQAVIAYYYGATFETDIYFISYGFTNGLSEAIIKAISVSALGIYTTLRIQEGQEEANKFISSLLKVLFPISLIMVGALFVFSPIISKVLAPTFSDSQLLVLSLFIRLFSFVFVFSGIELIGRAILDSHKSYYIPRLHSLVYSLTVIICCMVLYQRLGIYALLFAHYAASLVYALVLVFSVSKYIKMRLNNSSNNNYLKKTMYLAIPLIFGNSVIQINEIVDKAIASSLSEGSASALSYSHTLEQFVTSVMIVNLGNVLFSHFANLVAEYNSSEIKTTLKRVLEILTCILIPISIITIICAKDIVEIVYFRGSFTKNAVNLTSIVLIGYAISFPMVAVRDILTKSMYAYQDTRSPMINSIISILVNITSSIILSKYIGLLGVAIGTSISVYLGAFLNMKSFKRLESDFNYRFLLTTLIKAIPASLATSAVILVIKFLVPIKPLSLSFVIISICGFLVFFIILLILRAEEMCRLYKTYRNKFLIKKG